MNNLFHKIIIGLSIIFLPISCSKNNFLSSSYGTSLELLLGYFEENKSPFTREFVERIPYASSLISFNNQNKILIILESQNSLGNYWISSDGVRFKENNGRINQTIGLPNDLLSIERPEIDFQEIIDKKQINYITYYSYKKPVLNNLKIFVSSRSLGESKITILGKVKEVILIEEELYSEAVNWRVKNKYWIDPQTSFVWKSIQSWSPKLPELVIEVTKKPAI